MKVKIEGRLVEVLDKKCATRPCFSLGFDKGTYTQGRGYTSYHTDAKGKRIEKPVCMTRHLHGCPTSSVCERCRLCSVLGVGEKCEAWECGGTLVARAVEASS